MNTSYSGIITGTINTPETGFPNSIEKTSEFVQIQETKKLKSKSVILKSNLQKQIAWNQSQSMCVLESPILLSQKIFETKVVLPGIEEIVSGEEPDCDEGVANRKDNFKPRSLTKRSPKVGGGRPGWDSK